ncbi:MAG: polysaccharide biosynthesis/export family protein [Bacteroidota bacterium]
MKILFYLFITVLFLSSCGVRYESLPYFTDLSLDSTTKERIQNQSILKIQKNDILAINVNSLNPQASAIFNMGSASSPDVAPSSAPTGYLVDQNGNIQLPLIGSVVVVGLTTAEARALLEKKLVTFLKEPVVSLRLVNFRVSVLGEVSKPGVYPVSNERVNVSEALSMAGDLTITGIRNNVLLIREKDGVREYHRLNLQSKELFNSPYYYLQNNDILYIQPSKAKYASIDSSYRNVSLVLSALSVIALLITRF